MSYAPPPLVFCHFGATPYLAYTLGCVRKADPDRPVTVLGDAANRSLVRSAGAEHQMMEELPVSPLHEEFRRHYRLVQGSRHGNVVEGRDWVRFVFERWFYTYQYATARAPEGFWHFDSDTMILEPLRPYEADLGRFDCTEQCNGGCLNGFVGSLDVLRGYLESIVAQFKDVEFLEAQRAEFETKNPTFAFTEMRAYVRYKEAAKLNSVHIGRPRSGPDGAAVCFDDVICLDHGFETERLSGGGWYGGKSVKRVVLAEGGRCLGRLAEPSGTAAAGEEVRFATLNLSWVPLGVFATVLRHVEKGRTVPAAGADLATVGSVPPPAAIRWRQRAHVLKHSLRHQGLRVGRLTKRLGQRLSGSEKAHADREEQAPV
ncbi:hypothetical protein [Alienimonas sp. DA493]|uniref:hypothetical protein n=1 Tax=Alienimonas sp. DA493 TaxID=3373605 RepID=UPI003754306A